MPTGRPVLTLLCLAAAAFSPAPRPWPRDRFAAWPSGPLAFPLRDRTEVIAAAGLTARVERKRCGEGRPVSEACGDFYVNVALSAPGVAPFTLEGAAGLRWFIGVGRLGREPRPAFILVTDGGGSGGCVTIDAALPQGAGYRTARLRLDGAQGLCRVNPEKLAWPRDLTGHGRAEWRLNDARFACAFASCAGSWTPPRIVALEGVRLVDVSSDPALAPLYRTDMAKARAACARDGGEPAGPCAAYAADAARVGQAPQARAFIAAQVSRRADNPCCVDNSFPPQFAANLTLFLHQTGYDGSPATFDARWPRPRYVPDLGLTLPAFSPPK